MERGRFGARRLERLENWAALGVDVLFAVIPFVPSGGGQIISVGNKIDNALDVANIIDKAGYLQDVSKVTMIGRNMTRVKNTAHRLNIADDLYKTWKGYKVGAKGIKKGLYNIISMGHNGGWLFNKLRTGYKVIDIGITTGHTGLKALGLWYGIERTILSIWQTRNIWKLWVNYYS